jgi:hypothetical protein
MLKKQRIKPSYIGLSITLLLCCRLEGSETISAPFSFMTGLGFEETTTQWSSPIASENYEHIKFIVFQLEGSSIARNVFLGLRATYGILGTGAVECLDKNQSTFFSTHGSLADSWFVLGYLIPLTPDRPTLTYLTPETGYSGSWLTLYTSYTCFTELWYGPFFGGSLKISTNQGFTVRLTYHYHWLTLHHTLYLYSLERTKLKFHNAYGHEAELNIQTYLFQNIKIGAALHYFYYSKATSTPYNAHREDLSIALQYIYEF